MWPLLACLALAGVILLAWLWLRERRRATRELEPLRQSIRLLSDERRDLSAQERARQQTLFDGMVEGVLLVNAQGRIELLNLALKRLLGLTTEVRGQSLHDALRLPQLDVILARVGADGQMVGSDLDLMDTMGRYLQVNASIDVGPDGQRRGTAFVFHDLTRVKQFEDTRRDFVANVSHELRTPLNLIKGFVQTLLEGGAETPEQSARYLQTIAKHTDRLTFLIEDLLTLSRLEGGEAALNLQPVAARLVVQRVLDDLQPRLQERKMNVALELPESFLVHADSDRLEQVFFNLVENAIKYGRAGGQIVIGARVLPDSRFELFVKDDGPGIPLENRDRVFERFYRVDRARSRDTGGTGLGLAIVKHIVNAHGGQVWVQSELGSGSTFFFTLAGLADHLELTSQTARAKQPAARM